MGFWEPKIVSMFRIVSNSVFWLTFFLGCADQSAGLPYYNSPDFTPHFLNDPLEVENKISHSIEDFSVKSHRNQIITKADLKGKVHIANFMFTRCTNIFH